MMKLSASFEPLKIGGHVHVKVRVGQAGSRALCGDLTMRDEDWALVSALLVAGEEELDHEGDRTGYRGELERRLPEYVELDPDGVLVFQEDAYHHDDSVAALVHLERLLTAVEKVIAWESDADALPPNVYAELHTAYANNPDVDAAGIEWATRVASVRNGQVAAEKLRGRVHQVLAAENTDPLAAYEHFTDQRDDLAAIAQEACDLLSECQAKLAAYEDSYTATEGETQQDPYERVALWMRRVGDEEAEPVFKIGGEEYTGPLYGRRDQV